MITGCFALNAPKSWDATRRTVNASLDLVASLGGGSVYFTPGRTAAVERACELLAAMGL
ncbi:MAG TPA: hypothetical protein VK437_17655 [Steroidobacteraceae bacterium]|nr:hypothetical protein [Steroidobacteraceae bacterium]